jgi:hypothetical protein
MLGNYIKGCARKVMYAMVGLFDCSYQQISEFKYHVDKFDKRLVEQMITTRVERSESTMQHLCT